MLTTVTPLQGCTQAAGVITLTGASALAQMDIILESSDDANLVIDWATYTLSNQQAAVDFITLRLPGSVTSYPSVEALAAAEVDRSSRSATLIIALTGEVGDLWGLLQFGMCQKGTYPLGWGDPVEIRLTRQDPVEEPMPYQMGLRLRVTASCSGLPSEIFVHTLGPDAVPVAAAAPEFSHIASLTDLVDYPALTPDTATSRYYRLATVDLVARTLEEIEEAWDLTLSDCSALKQAAISQTNLTTGTEWII